MGVSISTYYGLTKVRDAGPSIKDWAATDHNIETISKLLRYFEQHSHNAASAINYPGYDPVTPIPPTLTEQATGGVLTPATPVGVRLAYRNALGLETQASPEAAIVTAGVTPAPLTPQLVSTQAASPGLAGGTYIYATTKKKATGETTISNVLPVEIPYDSTYSVTISFEAINTFTDGTTGINIYRAEGLNSAFILVSEITSPAQTTFTDTNTIPAQNQNIQPPAISTFDASKKVRINWAALTHPASATALRIYVTQIAGLWSDTHLLTEVDLTAAPPNFIDYLGNEILQPGWPNEVSQIPSGAPKVNLSTDVVGGLTTTSASNFAGFPANNLVLGDIPTVTKTDGMIWYDQGTDLVRVRINGTDQTLAQAGASFVHSVEEQGGHIAANIKFVTGSAVTSKNIFDQLRNSVTGARKQVNKFGKPAIVTSDTTTTSTAAVQIPDLSTSATPDFDNQWFHVRLGGHFRGSAYGMNISIAIEYDGALIEESIRTVTVPATNGNVELHTEFTGNLGTLAAGSKTVKGLWWVDSGTATAVGTRRSLVAEVVL